MRKGKKTLEWEKIRAKLKKECLVNGWPLRCEIRFEGCWGHADGFAHSKTRQHMGPMGSEEREVNLRTVVLACNSCHEKIEKQPYMEELILTIIRRRNENKISCGPSDDSCDSVYG